MAKKEKTKPVNKAKPKKKRHTSRKDAVAVPKQKMGRPAWEYSDKLADRICEALANSTYGLNQVCADKKNFPSPTKIYQWLTTGGHAYFQEKYARAREMQAMRLVDQITELTDKERVYIVETEGTNEFGAYRSKTKSDNWQRTRLQIEARKWMASKLFPKIFGDKIKQEVTGADGQPLIPIAQIEIVHSNK